MRTWLPPDTLKDSSWTQFVYPLLSILFRISAITQLLVFYSPQYTYRAVNTSPSFSPDLRKSSTILPRLYPQGEAILIFAHQPFPALSSLSTKTPPCAHGPIPTLILQPGNDQVAASPAWWRSCPHLSLCASGSTTVSCFLSPSYLMMLSNHWPHLSF